MVDEILQNFQRQLNEIKAIVAEMEVFIKGYRKYSNPPSEALKPVEKAKPIQVSIKDRSLGGGIKQAITALGPSTTRQITDWIEQNYWPDVKRGSVKSTLSGGKKNGKKYLLAEDGKWSLGEA